MIINLLNKLVKLFIALLANCSGVFLLFVIDVKNDDIIITNMNQETVSY